MAGQTQPRLTPEQYLEIERAAGFKSEYYNGRMYAMAGGSYRHALIIGQLARELGNALKKSPCVVTVSDVRVRVGPDKLYTYPDLIVVCGDAKFMDGRTDTLVNPAIIVEVLSPSTEVFDRGYKFAQYRTIETLQEYALVSQTEARVEIFRRQDGGHWLLTESVGLDSVSKFESVGASVALSEIYDKISFEPEEA